MSNNYLSIEELANIFCVQPKEIKDFLQSRNFNLNFIKVGNNDLIRYDEVQMHLRSQYFI